MQLKDTQLFRQQAYIDGTWLDADNGQSYWCSAGAIIRISLAGVHAAALFAILHAIIPAAVYAYKGLE